MSCHHAVTWPGVAVSSCFRAATRLQQSCTSTLSQGCNNLVNKAVTTCKTWLLQACSFLMGCNTHVPQIVQELLIKSKQATVTLMSIVMNMPKHLLTFYDPYCNDRGVSPCQYAHNSTHATLYINSLLHKQLVSH